jgi:hypothetical protein
MVWNQRRISLFVWMWFYKPVVVAWKVIIRANEYDLIGLRITYASPCHICCNKYLYHEGDIDCSLIG